jgi:DNA/RNA endonuclease G (NUC1)
VTGTAFQGTAIQSIGPDGVLVPTATWKAVYDPQADGAGVYVCGNTAEPTCTPFLSTSWSLPSASIHFPRCPTA